MYLPKGTHWFDFWTNTLYSGGQTLICETPLETIPLFVKSGSIVPVSEPLLYADQRGGETSEILIYSGENGEFTLYNDEGDNYSYENGNFSAIKLFYNDKEKALTFGKAMGAFQYQENFKIKVIECDHTSKVIEFIYKGKAETISLR